MQGLFSITDEKKGAKSMVYLDAIGLDPAGGVCCSL